jgi:hypothetical protein
MLDFTCSFSWLFSFSSDFITFRWCKGTSKKPTS